MEEVISEIAGNNINACAVNWGKLSLDINYFFVAHENTVRVANYLHIVLRRLERLGVDVSKITLVGHSLGAQIAGKIGAKFRMEGKAIGSIYGLFFVYSTTENDPTNVIYSHLELRPRSSRSMFHISL